MADPLSIFGAVGSVAGLIDVLSRSIGLVGDLRAQYKGADLMLMSLNSQLLALRTGLAKIWEWAETIPGGVHYQLIMDLDSVILCCQTLASKLDSQLLGLQQSGRRLSSVGKLKLVLNGRTIDDIQKMIERQTGALTLLLTACNSKSLAEQQQLVEVSATRTVITTVENDSSSLIVHHDRNSICTTETDTMSNVSARFPFDDQLLTSRVYDRAWRTTMLRKAMPRHRKTVSDSTTTVAPKAPVTVGDDLPARLTEKSKVKILLIGEPTLSEA